MRFRLSTSCLAILAALCISVPSQAQSSKGAGISGVVTNEHGAPLEIVNVQLIGTLEGSATDSNGRFRFKTSQTGVQHLRASMIGFEPTVMELTISPGDSLYVSIVLTETIIMLEEIVVTASAFTTGDQGKSMTFRSLDVVTTPSANADIARAVQTLPGVVAMDEGAGLYVRGGEVSETVMLLDEATLAHPYRYESPTGGYFGTIPPFLINGTFFSSGGFSAKYGNALSAVLAMETFDLPSSLTYTVGVGLAATSVAANIPAFPDKLGVRLSGNRSSTGLMFRMNGAGQDFTLTPRSYDGNLSVIYKYSPGGQLKFFNYINTDRVGVKVDEPSFPGIFSSEEVSRLHSLSWRDASSEWLFASTISLSSFGSERSLGNMNLKPSDESYQVRVDGTRMFGENLRLSIGAEMERLENAFEGAFPRNSSVLDPNADVFRLKEHFATQRWGGYGEVEAQLSRKLLGCVGTRTDYSHEANQVVLDPRLSACYQFSNQTRARLSWGVYHQFAEPYKLNEVSGNPNLRAQSAKHLVASLEYTADPLMVRLEAYHKKYLDLGLPDKILHWTNGGTGSAEGIDFFLKYGGFLQTRINGWISYSYLLSRRLQARDLVDYYMYERAPSPFDITHNLTIVAKSQLIGLLGGGLTFRYATGKPITPIVGAVYRDEGYYEPIEGPLNSQRLPDFIRLDVSLSYFLPFGTRNSAVFYLGVSNVLNRANPVEYEYSFDYSTRQLRTTDYRRFVYLGFVLSFGTLGTEI